MLTVQEALDKLATYGTADQIRDHLLSRGFRGRRRTLRDCPISRYLKKETGLSVAVQEHSAYYYIHRPSRGDVVLEEQVFALPRAVSEFVQWFDARGYPEMRSLL